MFRALRSLPVIWAGSFFLFVCFLFLGNLGAFLFGVLLFSLFTFLFSLKQMKSLIGVSRFLSLILTADRPIGEYRHFDGFRLP